MTERAGPERLAERLSGQAAYCEASSPFYSQLLRRMADDARARGPTWDLLGPTLDDPPGFVPQLGLLAAVHRRVLLGEVPALAAHYPSVGGDGDAGAAWPGLHDVLATREPGLTVRLRHIPQTNEVGRAAPLIGGLLTVAAETGLPVRLLEIGSSAGLNLRLDHFWYEAGGSGFGDPDAPVRFVDCWERGTPPFDAPLVVTDRRGCDRSPVDATTEEGRLSLLAYVWPDQTARFGLLRAALDVAARVPVTIDQADALAWLPGQLSSLTEGTTTVVFHSVVLQYLTPADQARLAALLRDRGRAATRDAPLAWLRLEPATLTDGFVELRLARWPEGDERVLARASFHVGPVEWLAGQASSDASRAPSPSTARRDAEA
jgi:hypothetical protein